MTERLDTPLAELLLARGLVGRPLLSEALAHVRRQRGHDEQVSLALFLLEREVMTPDLLQRVLEEAGRLSSSPDLWSETASKTVGEQLGPYRLLRKIAEGGMGAVYEAEHAETGARYALKVIKAEVGRLLDEAALERLQREARLSAALDHPGVVRVHAAEFDGPVPYLVQDLLAGGSLNERVRKAGVLAPDAAAELVARLAEGLAAAHEAGILHRDLKPDNVLFGEQGDPVLVDFGLSRRVGGNSVQLTQTGEILGTPAYMAPEQALDVSSAREPADVYALGAILYFALEGVAPFRGQTVLETLHLVLSKPAPEAESAPPALRALVARTLSKDPGKRPTATELAELLREAVRDPAPPSQLGPLVVAATAALVLLVLALGWASSRKGPVSTADPSAPSPSPTLSPTVSPTREDSELLALAQTVLEGRHRVSRTLAAVELLRRSPTHAAAPVAEGVIRGLERRSLLTIPALRGRAPRGAGFLPGGKSLFSLSAEGVGRFDVGASPAVWRTQPGPAQVTFSRGGVGPRRLWVSVRQSRGWIYSLLLNEVGEVAPRAPTLRPSPEWDEVVRTRTRWGKMATLALSSEGRLLAHGQSNRVILYDLQARGPLDLFQLPLDLRRGESGALASVAHLEFVGEDLLIATLNKRFLNPMEGASQRDFPSGGLVTLLKIESGRLRLVGAVAVVQAVTAILLTPQHVYVGNNTGTLRRYPLDSFPNDPRLRTSPTNSEAKGVLVTAEGGPGIGRLSGVRECPDGTLLTSHRYGETGKRARLGRWTPEGEGWSYRELGTTPLAQDLTLSSDGDLAFVEYHFRESEAKTHLGEIWFVGPIPGR